MTLTTKAILSCQVSEWYPRFKHLCYSRQLIPLTKEFTQFLLSDQIIVRGKTQFFGQRNQTSESPSENEEPDEESENEQEEEKLDEEFPDIMHQIQEAMDELGGCVFPKLNWSAPTDAIWLSPDKTMKCTCSEEVESIVVLFLRSSDRIAHDICAPFDDDQQGLDDVTFVLCLTKYCELRPQSGFRFFVKNDKIVGISQRDATQFYPQIEGTENQVKEICTSWFERYIKGNFELVQYSIDVYMTSKKRLKLIDFNAVCTFSSPLLFSWDELNISVDNSRVESSGDELEVEVRLVPNDGSLMLGTTHAVSMPYDMIGCSLTDILDELRQQTSQSN